MFPARAKTHGQVDRAVSYLRFEGEWVHIVPGSFYIDGDGGFACTVADDAPGGREELVGPVWALQDLIRESPIGGEASHHRRRAWALRQP